MGVLCRCLIGGDGEMKLDVDGNVDGEVGMCGWDVVVGNRWFFWVVEKEFFDWFFGIVGDQCEGFGMVVLPGRSRLDLRSFLID